MHTPSMTGERRIVEWTVNLSGGFGQRSSPGASESSLVWELTGNRRALSGDVGQGDRWRDVRRCTWPPTMKTWFPHPLPLRVPRSAWGAGYSSAWSPLGRWASFSVLGSRAWSGMHSDPVSGGCCPGGDRFRIYTVSNSFPDIPGSRYRLEVSGLVDRPLTLTLDDLMSMPSTKLVKDFQCVTGWRVPQVHWEGVRLSNVLDAAGVQGNAKALAFDSYDGLDTESLTLDQARRPDVIVAYRMLGAPVTTEHGGPVRLYVAPMYGYKSLKWLSAIRVVDRVEPGYWEQNGYAVNGWIGSSNGGTEQPVD